VPRDAPKPRLLWAFSVRIKREHKFDQPWHIPRIYAPTRALRVDKHLSLDEIAERLSLSRTTVYYWIKDLPLGRPKRWSVGQRKGNKAMQKSGA
jgi:hypothetical protein